MRNIPLSFITEETLQHLAELNEEQKGVEQAKPVQFGRQTLPQDSTEQAPSLIERLKNAFNSLANTIATIVDADGPRSIANFERAMRGTRSLAR